MSHATEKELQQLCVLYVEDEIDIRQEVSHYLKHKVGRVIVATDGKEGLAAFNTFKPDIVISDIMMPVMDGIAMAEAIRKQGRATPIIFTTAFNDTRYLHQAIALGIEGYVLKPIDLKQLVSTIAKCTALLFRKRELLAHKAQLETYHQAAEEERHLVAALMERMMRPDNLHDSHLHYWLKPTDVVSGDLIAFCRTQNHKLYVMLADSTGHGLPAALNLLPVNHIFYSMARKHLPVSLMIDEMNWAVNEQSPADRYVAALVACIDQHNHLVEIWNGGIPTALFVDSEGNVQTTFKSTNLPLGVLDKTLTAETNVFQWNSAGQMIIYSDGFIEAENENGNPFGEERILEAIKNSPPSGRYTALIEALNTHLGKRHAFDDITLIVVDCDSSG